MSLADPTNPIIVDTIDKMSSFIDSLRVSPDETPSLYVDLEGENLSRQGTVCVLQILVLPTQRVYLIDISTLGAKAFSTMGVTRRYTLKSVLEAEKVTKVFFDVRNDSDALYAHYGINLAGVQDLQLMELASRAFSRQYVSGLNKCIEKDAPLSDKERMEWVRVKERGMNLFLPARGGSHAVFAKRPLPQDLINYCAQDVQILPRLWSHYRQILSPAWKDIVATSSKDRVVQSQQANYDGHSRQKALGPRGW